MNFNIYIYYIQGRKSTLEYQNVPLKFWFNYNRLNPRNYPSWRFPTMFYYTVTTGNHSPQPCPCLNLVYHSSPPTMAWMRTFPIDLDIWTLGLSWWYSLGWPRMCRLAGRSASLEGCPSSGSLSDSCFYLDVWVLDSLLLLPDLLLTVMFPTMIAIYLQVTLIVLFYQSNRKVSDIPAWLGQLFSILLPKNKNIFFICLQPFSG